MDNKSGTPLARACLRRRPASARRNRLLVDSDACQVAYSTSDVWLLASIEYSSNQSGLGIRDIIAVGDYLNHAIFTENEFREGLCRLSMGGWIIEKRGRFKVSKKFKSRNIRYTSPKGRHSTQKLWEQVEGLLCGDNGCGKAHPAGNLRYPGFTSKKFNEALKDYMR